jgi:predicted ATP-grasp superfamily ATP-dependent carboligase
LLGLLVWLLVDRQLPAMRGQSKCRLSCRIPDETGRDCMRVLIVATGWNNRGALVTSRALAKAGWEVGCVTADLRGLLAASRSISHLHRAPPPAADLHGFIEATGSAISARSYEAVLPSSDAETLALSALRQRLPIPLPYPAHDAVLGAFDKLELTRVASTCGIGAPWTTPASQEALGAIEGPVVVKARFHWTPGSVGMPARWRTYICADQREAGQRIVEMRAAGGDPLLQEVVRGPLLHCHVLQDRHGGLVAAVQQRSEPVTQTPLTWPPGAGVRVRSVTVPPDRELVEKITAMLGRLGWVGFVGLMFIVGADGEPRLVDFNGRIPMSFQQSIAACPALPDLWARVAAGQPIDAVPEVQTGVRYQWLWGDLRRAVKEGRRGRVLDVLGCLAYASGATHGIWSTQDPWPALRSGQRNLGQLARRLSKASRPHRASSALGML